MSRLRASSPFFAILFAGPVLAADVVRPGSLCGPDDRIPAACAPVAQRDPSRRVARLVTPSGESCTGWLVSCESHFVTAAHCLPDGVREESLTAVFLDREAACGTSSSGPIAVRVAEIERISRREDVALLRLDTSQVDPAALFGWFETSAESSGEAFVPQHPGGGPQRTVDRNGAEPCRFRAIGETLFHDCDTSGGSSGAPVVSAASARVVGLHVRGGFDAACSTGNEAVPAASFASLFGSLPSCSVCPGPGAPRATAVEMCGGAEIRWEAVPGETYRVYGGADCASTQILSEGAEPRHVDHLAHAVYRVEAIGACGAASSGCFAPVPGEPPRPADPMILGDCEDRLVLGEVYPGATRYELLRSDGGCGLQPRLLTWSATPSFLDPNADPDRTYGYAIRATSGCGRSEPSACLVSPGRARSPDRPAPPALSAECGSVLVTWDRPTRADRTELHHSRSGCAGPFLPIASSESAGAFVDRETGHEAVAYRVVAFTGCSGAASACVETAPPLLPAAPAAPTVESECDALLVAWPAVAGALRYVVERGLGGAPLADVAEVAEPAFRDVEVPLGETARYRIRAIAACPGAAGPEGAGARGLETCAIVRAGAAARR